MDWKLEVVLLPVSDVDASKAFYSDVLGFHLDVDHHPNEQFRVVQLTPPGSACSVTFGVGLTDATPGCYRGTHLVVDDIETAAADLTGRGLAVNGPYHFGPEGRGDGLHPDREDFGTFLDFADPDGNTWIVQERGHAAASS